MPIDIKLPQAKVILLGGTTSGYKYKGVNVQQVKELTFGDNVTPTEQGTTSTTTIMKNGSSNWNNGTIVNVLGNATVGTITAKNENAKVNIGGVKDAATNDYYPGGVVNKLQFNQNSPAVTVVGNGVIKDLLSNYTAVAADPADGTVVTFGAADIQSVSAGEANFDFSSTWDGVSSLAPTSNNVYTAAQFASYRTGITADVTINIKSDIDLLNKAWDGINGGANSVTLVGTNSNWKGTGANPTLAGTSEFHSIINLDLAKGVNEIADANTAALTKTGLGLISVAKDVTISTGLNIKTVNCVLNKYYDKNDQATSGTYDFAIHGIGSLVGHATGDVSLTNVKVMLAGNKFGYGVSGSKGTYIGGIVGKAEGTITITKSEVNMTPGSSTMICGYYNLGGIVGGESANDKAIVIGNSTAGNGCTVNIGGFTVDYNNGKTIDKNMGRVGGFIGSAGSMKAENVYWNGELEANVTLYGTATVTTWPTQAMMKNKIIQGSAPDFDYLTYTKMNDFIGYCGDKIIKLSDSKPNTINVNSNVAKTTPLTKPDGSDNQGKALYWFE